MSMSDPSITNAVFKAKIELPVVAPAVSEDIINIPLSFANATNIVKQSGTYTPSNDYLYLWQSIPAAEAPTFMIIIVDSPIAIACQFAKSQIVYSPSRFSFIQWAQDPANLMAGCFIDGRTGPNPGNTPMAQGVPVNYTVIFGQATIS